MSKSNGEEKIKENHGNLNAGNSDSKNTIENFEVSSLTLDGKVPRELRLRSFSHFRYINDYLLNNT